MYSIKLYFIIFFSFLIAFLEAQESTTIYLTDYYGRATNYHEGLDDFFNLNLIENTELYNYREYIYNKNVDATQSFSSINLGDRVRIKPIEGLDWVIARIYGQPRLLEKYLCSENEYTVFNSLLLILHMGKKSINNPDDSNHMTTIQMILTKLKDDDYVQDVINSTNNNINSKKEYFESLWLPIKYRFIAYLFNQLSSSSSFSAIRYPITKNDFESPYNDIYKYITFKDHNEMKTEYDLLTSEGKIVSIFDTNRLLTKYREFSFDKGVAWVHPTVTIRSKISDDYPKGKWYIPPCSIAISQGYYGYDYGLYKLVSEFRLNRFSGDLNGYFSRGGISPIEFTFEATPQISNGNCYFSEVKSTFLSSTTINHPSSSLPRNRFPITYHNDKNFIANKEENIEYLHTYIITEDFHQYKGCLFKGELYFKYKTPPVKQLMGQDLYYEGFMDVYYNQLETYRTSFGEDNNIECPDIHPYLPQYGNPSSDFICKPDGVMSAGKIKSE